MKINLTKEELEKIKEDGWISIEYGQDLRIYAEVDDELHLDYIEYVTPSRVTGSRYFATKEDLELLKPKRCNDPNYFHNDPLCPHCGTYMIYNFEHCPKCGQKIDYSEE